MSKNIVVFSDGTGQDGGNGPNTNVYKIFNVIENRTPRQIAFYDPGLGSRKLAVMGKAVGRGIAKNIKQCYRFIFENYESGDKIFLFGFSRGAATVRSLSGFIEMFGVLPKSRPELIDQAYRIYKRKGNLESRDLIAKAFIMRHHTMWCKVEFLGVFDTVAALRGQSDYHNFKLSNSVYHGRHALSVDETRIPFEPIFWEKEIQAHQTMKQVWFPGVHTDVGGGYKERALSDISFNWMLDEAEQCGLRIFDKSRRNPTPNPNGFMHKEKYLSKRLKWKYHNRARQWNEELYGDLVAHESVYQRDKTIDNLNGPYNPWIKNNGCITEQQAFGSTPIKKVGT